MALGRVQPILPATVTRRVGPSEQGQLQGANQSLMAIAELFGPSIFTLTFAAFIAKDRSWDLPGAPFLLAAVLLLVSFSIGLVVTRESTSNDGLVGPSADTAVPPTAPVP